MAQLMLCKCTQMSVEVCEIVFETHRVSPAVAEWNSGDRGNTIKWNTTANASVIYHNVTLRTQTLFNEINNQAQWGSLYYAIKPVSYSPMSHFITHSL